MTDEEIVLKINVQLYVAVALQIMASCTERLDPFNMSRVEYLHKTARLFTSHALRLLATNRLAVARWMDTRSPEAQWVARLQ
jgi:hypothetical protein